MPDWLSPFHLPELSDSEYAKAKAAYIEKNGYTITIPGLSDIIKIRTEEPMSALEHHNWKKKNWDYFSPKRLEQCKKQKAKRLERYTAMLASPTPAIMQNAGSIMCAIDDAQDAISTLGVIGRLAARIAPKAIGPLIQGPVGLLITASDMLNIIQAVPQACLMPMMGKRKKETLQKGSPRHNMARLKSADKITKALPTKGDWIQAAQTTEQVFGFGVSLGPIVGLIQDIFWGTVRSRPGVAPKIKLPAPDLKHWYKAAHKMAKAATILWGFSHETDDEDILLWLAATELAFQALQDVQRDWNPLEQVEDIANLEVKAPVPWHTLTIEVILEETIPFEDSLGWPQTGQLWETIKTLVDTTHWVAAENLHQFTLRNKHNWTGYAGAVCAVEGAMFSVTVLEGEEFVEYHYSVPARVANILLQHSLRLDPHQPIEKFTAFVQYMIYLDDIGQDPDRNLITSFCEGSASIKLVDTSTTWGS